MRTGFAVGRGVQGAALVGRRGCDGGGCGGGGEAWRLDSGGARVLAIAAWGGRVDPGTIRA